MVRVPANRRGPNTCAAVANRYVGLRSLARTRAIREPLSTKAEQWFSVPPCSASNSAGRCDNRWETRAVLAQLAEQWFCKPPVPGSRPGDGSDRNGTQIQKMACPH